MYERVRLLLFGGIDPVTTVTLVSFSFVPWPNALSFEPLGRSTNVWSPGFPANVTQSVWPAVLTVMLPSLPSNVLGEMTAPEDATKITPKTTAATSVAPATQYLRPLSRWELLSLLIYFLLLLIKRRAGARS